jgi:hypothetical protein
MVFLGKDHWCDRVVNHLKCMASKGLLVKCKFILIILRSPTSNSDAGLEIKTAGGFRVSFFFPTCVFVLCVSPSFPSPLS